MSKRASMLSMAALSAVLALYNPDSEAGSLRKGKVKDPLTIADAAKMLLVEDRVKRHDIDPVTVDESTGMSYYHLAALLFENFREKYHLSKKVSASRAGASAANKNDTDDQVDRVVLAGLIKANIGMTYNGNDRQDQARKYMKEFRQKYSVDPKDPNNKLMDSLEVGMNFLNWMEIAKSDYQRVRVSLLKHVSDKNAKGVDGAITWFLARMKKAEKNYENTIYADEVRDIAAETTLDLVRDLGSSLKLYPYIPKPLETVVAGKTRHWDDAMLAEGIITEELMRDYSNGWTHVELVDGKVTVTNVFTPTQYKVDPEVCGRLKQNAAGAYQKVISGCKGTDSEKPAQLRLKLLETTEYK